MPGVLDLHLTEPNQQLAEYRRATYAGMAHWAGSGPISRTCRECKYWMFARRYYSANGKHAGQLKDEACDKYRTLMSGELGPAIPHNARACKYFELAIEPAPLRMKNV